MINNILEALRAERDRLDAAITALEGKHTRKDHRVTSDAVRRKQSLAAKKRWRVAKRAGKNSL